MGGWEINIGNYKVYMRNDQDLILLSGNVNYVGCRIFCYGFS